MDEAFAEVTVSVDDDHVADLDEVVTRLLEAGMAIDDVLPELGVITGRIADADADRLSDVEGVAHVERSRGFQLAPPDSEIQ